MCVLARLQKDVTDPVKKREFRHWDAAGGMWPNFRVGQPLPAPPPRLALPAPEAKAVPDGGRGPSTEERWSALRVARRAQGLCMRCSDKWSRDHQCPLAVQLHVVQELLDVLQVEETQDTVVADSDQAGEQLFLTLSAAAVIGVAVP